jgi:hypothetical protein
MCGQEKYIRIIIENIMNAIAMVHIIVNDQNTLQFVDTLCITSSHYHIAKNTKSHGSCRHNMVLRGLQSCKIQLMDFMFFLTMPPINTRNVYV